LIGAVVCVVAAALRFLANQLSLFAIVQRGWSRHRHVSTAIEESDLFTFFTYSVLTDVVSLPS